MIAMYDGRPVFGPRGPAGPDGNPIGTVISFMGIAPPKDYLVCDGAEYDITKYSQLAKFFESQFGSSNHFGGDGTSTFAVPDLRNLFLRGYHGEADDQLSGEIGEIQEPTSFPRYLYTTSNTVVYRRTDEEPADINHPDKMSRSDNIIRSEIKHTVSGTPSNYGYRMTSRPVNAAVLYCIKAVTSTSIEDTYSTEETMIGTWIDGKPIYRRTRLFTSPSKVNTIMEVCSLSDIDYDTLVTLSGIINKTDGSRITFPGYMYESTYCSVWIGRGVLSMIVTDPTLTNLPAHAILEYTKTTD